MDKIDIERNDEEKLKKHLAFVNPFKKNNFSNPGKTFEESRKRVEAKVKRIKEYN